MVPWFGLSASQSGNRQLPPKTRHSIQYWKFDSMRPSYLHHDELHNCQGLGHETYWYWPAHGKNVCKSLSILNSKLYFHCFLLHLVSRLCVCVYLSDWSQNWGGGCFYPSPVKLPPGFTCGNDLWLVQFLILLYLNWMLMLSCEPHCLHTCVS